MKCAGVREWMLEADLEELKDAAPSTFGAHLASCDACRAAAGRILDAESRLAEVVASVGAARAPEDVAQRALGARRPRRWWPALVPLAAAAGLLVMLMGRRGGDVRMLESVERPTSSFAVEAPPGTSVAVFETDNPKITVVWFY